MRRLMTYPVGLLLKTYITYATFLVEKDKRKVLREEEKLAKKNLIPNTAK